jgi:hypothetical protein
MHARVAFVGLERIVIAQSTSHTTENGPRRSKSARDRTE